MKISRLNRQFLYGFVGIAIFFLCIIKIFLALVLSVILLIAHEIYIFIKWAFLSDKNRFDVNMDFNYNFLPELFESKSISINNNSFTWPEGLKPEHGCVLLEVKLKPSLLGWLRDPHVILDRDKESFYQYFARGSGGKRYINVTRLIKTVKQHDHIKLKTVHCALPNQNAKLIAFKVMDFTKDALLVVSPHPDDAEIAAFGLYSSNSQSSVVTITAGEGRYGKYNLRASGMPIDKAQQAWLAGTLRAWDSITIPILGGVAAQRIMNLGYYDGSLARMYQQQATHMQYTMPYHFRSGHQCEWLPEPKEHSWRQLVTDLETIIVKTKARNIACPHPLLDKHLDHQYTTIAVMEAIENLGLTDGYLLLYVNHPIYSDSYPYGTMNSEVGLPPWFHREIEMGGLYCQEVGDRVQILKLHALEAMHDLRPMFYQRRHGWRELRKRLYSCNKLNGRRWQFGHYQNFYRRSLRPQELFFVVPFQHIPQLQLDWLHNNSLSDNVIASKSANFATS